MENSNNNLLICAILIKFPIVIGIGFMRKKSRIRLEISESSLPQTENSHFLHGKSLLSVIASTDSGSVTWFSGEYRIQRACIINCLLFLQRHLQYFSAFVNYMSTCQ